MQFNPKVSIIIPVFNGSNYLREAIDSALAQSYSNIEVIVVNDGSCDEGRTEDIALSYGEKIQYLFKENGGVATALNMGINRAHGDYISWLSHDDIYYPHKIEAQIRFLNTFDENVIIFSDYDIINELSETIGVEKIKCNPEYIRYFLTVSHPINGCTVMMKKSVLDDVGLFNADLRTTQDYDLWFRMASISRFVHIDDSLIQSRAHSEQGTHAMSDLHVKEINELLSRFARDLSAQELMAATGKPLGLSYAQVALNFNRRGFYAAAEAAITLSKKYVRDQGFFDRMKTFLTYVLLHRS